MNGAIVLSDILDCFVAAIAVGLQISGEFSQEIARMRAGACFLVIEQDYLSCCAGCAAIEPHKRFRLRFPLRFLQDLDRRFVAMDAALPEQFFLQQEPQRHTSVGTGVHQVRHRSAVDRHMGLPEQFLLPIIRHAKLVPP